MFPEPIAPVEPLLPICNVPVLMVVLPEYELDPDKIKVLELFWVKLPVPLILPDKICPAEELYISVPALLMLPA